MISAILLTLLLAGASNQANEPPDSLIIQMRSNLYRVYDNFDEEQLLATEKAFEELQSSYPKSWIVRYYTALAESFLADIYLVTQENKKLAASLESGISQIEECIKLNEAFAEAYILLAKLYAGQAYLDPYAGRDLSGKILVNLNRAEQLEPDNPRLHFISGLISYFAPPMVGGGAEVAKIKLKQALGSFARFRPANKIYPDWGHKEAHAWLGQIAAKQDSLQLAKSHYQKALAIDPDYLWVKARLLPELHTETSVTPAPDSNIKVTVWTGFIAGFVGLCVVFFLIIKKFVLTS